MRRLLALLAVAVLTHALAVWALPRLIMNRVLSRVTAEAQTPGAVFFPPLTDHLQRRVVMPSPDLLYAGCAFDVSQRPLRIRADPKSPQYWSIALYASNSDNFFVINDRQAAGAPVDLVLRTDSSTRPDAATAAGAREVIAPSSTGLLLMRVLVTDYEREKDTVEAARRSLRCEPLGAPP